MIEGEINPEDKDINGAIIIDRSPDYFKPILNYLRTGKVIIDPNINGRGVLQDAKYYKINTLIEKLDHYESDDNIWKSNSQEF